MIVIVCIDDNGGMMFNNRQQSKDANLIEKIAEIIKDNRLWLDEYSYEFFENMDSANINKDAAFLSEASQGEYCFVENVALSPYEKWIEKLIVFRWNRSYPFDRELLYRVEDFIGKEMLIPSIELNGETDEGLEPYAVITKSFGEFIGMKNWHIWI